MSSSLELENKAISRKLFCTRVKARPLQGVVLKQVLSCPLDLHASNKIRLLSQFIIPDAQNIFHASAEVTPSPPYIYIYFQYLNEKAMQKTPRILECSKPSILCKLFRALFCFSSFCSLVCSVLERSPSKNRHF